MKIAQRLEKAVVALFLLSAMSTVAQADLNKAKGTVDNIRQADPPSSSTTTRRTPEQAAREYRESGSTPGPQTVRTNPVPSPVNRNNPRNDPDVQRGFDQHQRQQRR